MPSESVPSSLSPEQTEAVDKLGALDLQGIEATVGLKLSAKGKFVVAEASAEATLSVKFTIKSQPAR